MNNIISVITEAASKKKLVEITYQDSKGLVTNRETEPYEIRDNSYYGFCILKNSIRKFKLSNILSAKMLDNEYRPKWSVKIP